MEVCAEMTEREALDREHVCQSLFNTLDYDMSGFIDFGELSSIASRVTPTQNLKETQELIETLDVNEDGQISREEFVEHLIEQGRELSDDEFVTAVMVRVRKQRITTPHERKEAFPAPMGCIYIRACSLFCAHLVHMRL